MSRHLVRRTRFGIALAMVGALSLAGCGGIEFESKLLDNVGISTGGLLGSGKHREQKLETRAGIVVPPSTDVLPVPGEGGGSGTLAVLEPSFPKNPESVAAQQKRAAEAKIKRECDPNNGEFGSRQSGQHSDFENRGTKHNAECSTPAKDLFSN